VFDKTNCQKFGAVAAVVQGIATAVAPQLSARLGSKLLEQNYENAGGLEPRPRYLRQIRALGVGMAAAGVAGLLLEAAADDEENE
jgi:cation transporter-like permease